AGPSVSRRGSPLAGRRLAGSHRGGPGRDARREPGAALGRFAELDDPVVEEDAATALAELDGAADRAVALGGEVRGLADKRFLELASARNLVDQSDLGECLRPIFLTVALRANS